MYSTNYSDTFIEVSDDCPVTAAEVPPQRGDSKTVANKQFEILINSPYKYTSDDILFSVYATKNGVSEEDLDKERARFFSKGRACFRSSPLPKRYGWGVHSNAEGKIAIYAVESEDYRKLTEDNEVKHIKAMRS